MARQPRLPACWVDNCHEVCTTCSNWIPRLSEGRRMDGGKRRTQTEGMEKGDKEKANQEG